MDGLVCSISFANIEHEQMILMYTTYTRGMSVLPGVAQGQGGISRFLQERDTPGVEATHREAQKHSRL